MKTYLLAVCGLAPQVVTETLYALNQQGVQVDAIRILTTRAGKDVCIGQLLRAQDGEYFKYLEQYGYDPEIIDFAPRHIRAVLNEDGTEINDIDTEEENERFLHLCMEEAFELTKDPQNRVLFSVAGGRKTMSSCLSLAAQCYARSQDRIYHVLVTPTEFLNCRDFFFPPKIPQLVDVKTSDEKPCRMETSLARLTLVPMPFFPLRGHLTPDMLNQPESPASLMLSLVREDQYELTIDLIQRKIIWKGVELDVSAARLALYTLFAVTKKQFECNRSSCQECDQCYLTYEKISEKQDELTELYLQMTTREVANKGIANLDNYEFSTYRSKLNKEITLCFGDYEARKLEIESLGKRPGVRYGIRLEKARIRIVS